MHTLSRIIVIIPIFIVICAVLIKFYNEVFPPIVPTHQVYVQPTPTPIVDTTKMSSLNDSLQVLLGGSTGLPGASSAAQLNLKDEQLCQYSDGKMSTTAYIKNNNVSLKFMNKHAENVVLKDDCIYKWEPGAASGEKICDVAQTLSTVQSLSSMGMMDSGSIFGMLVGETSASSAAFMKNAMSSCIKQPVNDVVFTLPQNVSFSESTTSPLNFGQ